MSDAGGYQCRDCGGPLRFGLDCRLRCLNAPFGQMFCAGRVRLIPRPPRPRLVEVFRCSGCQREEKVRIGAQLPIRWCECGGMLVFHRAQTR